MNRRKFLQTASLGLAGLLVVAPETKAAVDKIQQISMTYKFIPQIIFEHGQIGFYENFLPEYKHEVELTVEYESGKIIECTCENKRWELFRRKRGSSPSCYWILNDVTFKDNEVSITYIDDNNIKAITTMDILHYGFKDD